MNKKLKIALMVSLAINLIMLGFFIGGASKRHWHSNAANETVFNESKHMERGERGPLRRVILHLPDEQKDRAKKELKQLRQKNKETHRTIRQLRSELKIIVSEEPFDQLKFIETTAQIRQLKNRMERRHIQYISQVLAQLPEEKREKAMRHFFKRHHGRHSD